MAESSSRPVLITTDLDRTLIFSQRAIAGLGGALPAEAVEAAGEQTAGELCRAARDSIAALPAHVRFCVATSRSVARLKRLRLPFRVPYAIAANGGVVLADGAADPQWAARTRRLVSRAAPEPEVRAVLAGGAGGPGRSGSPPWLARLVAADPAEDAPCCLAIVDLELLEVEELMRIGVRCRELGWVASLVGRKLYAFPAGFGKEHAAAFVAGKVLQESGAMPRRLAAGDSEHDRQMLGDADAAWVPAGSELAAGANGRFVVTEQPGHAAAAQIAREWLDACSRGSRFHDHGNESAHAADRIP